MTRLLVQVPAGTGALVLLAAAVGALQALAQALSVFLVLFGIAVHSLPALGRAAIGAVPLASTRFGVLQVPVQAAAETQASAAMEHVTEVKLQPLALLIAAVLLQVLAVWPIIGTVIRTQHALVLVQNGAGHIVLVGLALRAVLLKSGTAVRSPRVPALPETGA